MAADGAGSFVVVWNSGGGQDGDGYGVFGRRFRLTGPTRTPSATPTATP